MPSPKEVTRLLLAWRNGDREAPDKLMPLVYDELRRLARHYMRRERPGHTLQTSALINEAYLRLVDQDVAWESRTQFFAVSARLMRQILVDHARQRNSLKRGGQLRISLVEAANLVQDRASDIMALDDALKSLTEIDAQQSRIVELRFFGGLTIEETAKVLGISHTTVECDWKIAKAWLHRELSRK